MRRLVSYMGIILLALLVSGWGSTLAAALCPHAGTNQALPVAEDHSCHSLKIETTIAQPHQGEHHQAGHELKAEPVTVLHQGGGHTALGLPAESCGHCVSQSEFPIAPASMRELTVQKRDTGQQVANQTTLSARPAIAVSVSRFVPSQHAPPGIASRKHLILGVFLI